MTVFVVIDTKTSSIRPDSRVIELGVVRILLEYQDETLHGSEVNEWDTLLNPGTATITPAATKTHGITKRHLSKEPTFEDVVETVTEKVSGDVLVFHDTNLDADRLASEYGKLGHPVPRGSNQIVDTKKLAEQVGLPTDIDELAERLEVTGQSDRALPTAKLIAGILTHLVRDHGIELESLEQPRAKLTKLQLQIIGVEREEAWALAAGRKFSPTQAGYLQQLRERQAALD
jgi:DNA polymerase III epsilon subunit-like protein